MIRREVRPRPDDRWLLRIFDSDENRKQGASKNQKYLISYVNWM
jgi:hypothetical protein